MGVSVRAVPPGFASTHRHFHTVEEEWVFVLSGTGEARLGPHRIDVRAGSFVGLPPGPRPHHFLATGSDPLVFLEGGERIPGDDVWYPDLGQRVLGRKSLEEVSEFPPEEGDPAQCVHVEDLETEHYDHPVEPRAHRDHRSLHTVTGLTRQAVRWVRVAAGHRSTAYHTHERTDEWVYLMRGRATARVGDDRFQVEAGDFLAHPAGGPAHVMESETPLVYLVGGQIDPDDVVTYPEAGKQFRAGRFEPLDS